MKRVYNNWNNYNRNDDEKSFYDIIYNRLDDLNGHYNEYKNTKSYKPDNSFNDDFRFNYDKIMKLIRNNLIDIKGYIDSKKEDSTVVCGFEKSGDNKYVFKLELSDEYEKTPELFDYFMDIVTYVNNSLMYLFGDRVKIESDYENFEVGWTVSAF